MKKIFLKHRLMQIILISFLLLFFVFTGYKSVQAVTVSNASVYDWSLGRWYNADITYPNNVGWLATPSAIVPCPAGQHPLPYRLIAYATVSVANNVGNNALLAEGKYAPLEEKACGIWERSDENLIFNGPIPTGPSCGDSVCNGSETCSTCPGDCGACQQHYSCSGSSCVQDANGPYTSSNCNNACQVQQQKYSCSGNSCIPDMNGPYTDSNCNNACQPPPSANLNTITGCNGSTPFVYITWDPAAYLRLDKADGMSITTLLQSISSSTTSYNDNAVQVGGSYNYKLYSSGGVLVGDSNVSVNSCEYCGNGTCGGSENCRTCPGDCGVCPPVCGDGMCNGSETCSTCAGDCGVCPAVTATISANPQVIEYGGSSMLNWLITNATSMGSDFGASSYSGNMSVSPLSTRTYSVWGSGNGAPGSSTTTVFVRPKNFILNSPISSMCNVNQKPENILAWTASASGDSLVYRVYRDGVLITTLPQGTLTFTDQDPNLQFITNYNYMIEAYNGMSTYSNAVQVRTPYCLPPEIINFSATPSFIKIVDGNSSNLSWLVNHATKITLTQNNISQEVHSSSDPQTNISGTQKVTPNKTTSYTLSAEGPGGPKVEKTIDVTVGGYVKIAGTVYAGGDIQSTLPQAPKISYQSYSIISSGGKIKDILGNALSTIQDYNAASLWESIKNKMDDSEARITKDAKVLNINSYTNNFWYLDTDKDNPYDPPENKNKYPNGRVWIINGNLTLGSDITEEIKFIGKGTIVLKRVNGVENKLIIKSNLSYDNSTTDSLGIIADNMEIDINVFNLVGSYFIKNNIKM